MTSLGSTEAKQPGLVSEVVVPFRLLPVVRYRMFVSGACTLLYLFFPIPPRGAILPSQQPHIQIQQNKRQFHSFLHSHSRRRRGLLHSTVLFSRRSGRAPFANPHTSRGAPLRQQARLSPSRRPRAARRCNVNTQRRRDPMLTLALRKTPLPGLRGSHGVVALFAHAAASPAG